MIAGVPYDAQIAYLESTGTQLIDTGVKPDSLDLRIEMEMRSNGGHMFGSRATSVIAGNMGLWSAYSSMANSLRKDWLGVNDTFTLATTGSNTVVFTSTASGSSMTVNGTTETGGAKTTYDKPITLFGVNTVGTVSCGKLILFGCKIYKDGVLVADFIPVRVGQVGYLYDRVTRKLYGNAGTGSFTLGPDVATPVMSLHRMAERSVS